MRKITQKTRVCDRICRGQGEEGGEISEVGETKRRRRLVASDAVAEMHRFLQFSQFFHARVMGKAHVVTVM